MFWETFVALRSLAGALCSYPGGNSGPSLAMELALCTEIKQTGKRVLRVEPRGGRSVDAPEENLV